jgi:aerobic carbon-monoxide dehydrogenase medium subunit
VKPAPFTYHRPDSRDEVDALLAELGDDGKILAGGQSLIPILNMRLASPAHVIDINHLDDEPSDVEIDDGALRLGPLVRQETALRSESVAELVPLMAEAMRYVAHPPIRTRGTVVGSIAHADPAAELPAVLVVLGGEVVARSRASARTIPASQFFVGPLENSLGADEWVSEVRFPARDRSAGYAFEEFARRRGDYALCGVAASVRRAGDGRIELAMSYLGVADAPVRLTSGPVEGKDLDDAIEELVSDQLDPPGDIHASPEFRAHLARRLAKQAAQRALETIPEDQ